MLDHPSGSGASFNEQLVSCPINNMAFAVGPEGCHEKWAGGGVARRSRIDSDMLRSYCQSGSDRLAGGPF
jgi:hypothetical protein